MVRYSNRNDVYNLEKGEIFYYDGKRHVVEIPSHYPGYYDEEWFIIDDFGKTYYESDFPGDYIKRVHDFYKYRFRTHKN